MQSLCPNWCNADVEVSSSLGRLYQRDGLAVCVCT